MRLHDGLVGAGVAMAGAAIIASTLRFPRLEGGAPGPALFPQVIAVLMVGFGGSLAAPSIRRYFTPSPEAAVPRSGPDRTRIVNALLVFAAIIVWMLVAPPLGFLLTTAGILLPLMWWLGTPPLRAVLASAGLTLFVYVIFGKVLRVPLPLGILWF